MVAVRSVPARSWGWLTLGEGPPWRPGTDPRLRLGVARRGREELKHHPCQSPLPRAPDDRPPGASRLRCGRFEKWNDRGAGLRSGADPLVVPSLFRKRAFTGGLLAGLVFFAALIGYSLVFTLFMQDTGKPEPDIDAELDAELPHRPVLVPALAAEKQPITIEQPFDIGKPQ